MACTEDRFKLPVSIKFYDWKPIKLTCKFE